MPGGSLRPPRTLAHIEMVDLAEPILRQRAVIEWRCPGGMNEGRITDYLNRLVRVTDMQLVEPPFTSYANGYGWAAWAHIVTSGYHFQAWDPPVEGLPPGQGFGSCDLYSCKPFSTPLAVKMTRQFWDCSLIVFRDVLPELARVPG